MDAQTGSDAQMDVDALRLAHAALLARYTTLETTHSKLQDLYADTLAEKERVVEENSKLWQRFKGSSPKKSTQNSVGSSNSPRRVTGAERLEAGTPPNIQAKDSSHSPLRNSPLDDERFTPAFSQRSTKSPAVAQDNSTTSILPLRINAPTDSTVAASETQYLDEVQPVSPFFANSHSDPAKLEEPSPTKSPASSNRRSLGLGITTGSFLPDLSTPTDDHNSPNLPNLPLSPPFFGEPSPVIPTAPLDQANAQQQSAPAQYIAEAQDPPPRPVLTPAFLPYIRLRVGSTSMRTSDKGKVSVYLNIEVTVDIASDSSRDGGVVSWNVSKGYNDLARLDGHVRKLGKGESKLAGALPDKALFKDQTPTKVESRKTAVQAYLQSLIPIQGCGIKLCEFLNSDVVLAGGSAEGSGWLTKRGKSLGMWHSRYYLLSESRDSLAYYDSVGGAKLGEIKLANAEIGKQKTATHEYQHSFLIRTTAEDGDTDTILCASSDESRDDWIRALTRKPSSSEKKGTVSTRGIKRRSQPQPLASLGLTESTARSAAPQRSARSSKPTGSDLQSPLSTPSSLPELESHLSPSPQFEPLPELPDSSRSTGSRFNVSAPTNASPLPPGYDFKSDSKSREQQEKDRKGKTKSSFWGFNRNVAAAEKPPTPPPPPPPSGRVSFGVPLREAVLASPLSADIQLPAVVYRCLEFLTQNNAVAEEGIFRLSGSSNVIRSLRDRFDFEGDVDLIRSATFYDIHAIAGLLKSYLRELPAQQLLTRELSHAFISEILELEPEDRPDSLKERLALLPIENLTLITHLFKHLALIAENAEVNKMSIRNLAIVLSPSLAIPAPLFTLLIGEFSTNPPAPMPSPSLPLPPDSTGISGDLAPSSSSTSADAAVPTLSLADGESTREEIGLESFISLPPRSPGLPPSPRFFVSPLA